MANNSLLFIFFPIQLILLYFISRYTIREFFNTFTRFLSQRAVSIGITILFLPGTIMHELAHFVVAIILMLHVRQVSILPEFDHDSIKLGKVVYEKRDIFRSILVGIAPIFGGLFTFWLFSIWNVFPSSNILLSVVMGYLIFVISTSMFSSKQDLIDIVYIIPIGIVIAGIIYILGIDVTHIFPDVFLQKLSSFIQNINLYFLFSFIIHVGIIIILKLIKRLR